MELFCNNCDVVFSLLISGILGAIGQALRIWIGLYKLNLNKNPLVDTVDLSNPSNKLGGIFIGLLVGIILTLLTDSLFNSFSLERIIALIASGYAITDLIENVSTIIVRKQKSQPKHINQQLSSAPIQRHSLTS
ncbi:hypothetical protein [Flavobacterium sp.]|uniref:hypothetical protein n=1 Tax=Flavobacterium sp. TaxID=239 RepID=UPI00286AC1FF|nr:hypothetical protein [Flavobacterium sp.]